MRLCINESMLGKLGKYFYDVHIRFMYVCIYIYIHTHTHTYTHAVNVHEQQSGLNSLWGHESLIQVKKIFHKYCGLCNILIATHYLNVGCEMVT